MKKFVLVGLVLVFGLAMFAPLATAGDDNKKVCVCHVNEANTIPIVDAFIKLGIIIEVSENALDAHLAHGDATRFWFGDQLDWLFDLVEKIGLGKLPNAECAFISRD